MKTRNSTNEGLVDPTRWRMAVVSSSVRRVRGKQPEPKRVRKKGKSKGLTARARWCTTCVALKRDGPRHQHDFPNHKLVQLSEEQKSKIEDEEHPEKRATFNFGKYRGKPLTWCPKTILHTCCGYMRTGTTSVWKVQVAPTSSAVRRDFPTRGSLSGL